MAKAKKKNCYSCVSKRNNPGDCHIRCANPDPEMKGKEHGVRQGWFFYPGNFDPVWMDKECSNYEEKAS